MLWTIFVVLMVLWLLGFSLHVGGGLIHLLLVVAVIWLVWPARTVADLFRKAAKDRRGCAYAAIFLVQDS